MSKTSTFLAGATTMGALISKQHHEKVMGYIATAQRDLGFQPGTSIDAGVPRFVDWYREYYKV